MLLTKKDIPKIMLILLGSFFVGFAINGIFIPHRLLSGGVSGIAIFIHLQTGIEPAILVLGLNIPIFLLGYKLTDKKFILLSIIGMIGVSVSLSLTKHFIIPTEDMFTSVLLGGVINGFGLGIVFRGNGSTGGTDVIAKIFNKFFSVSMGFVLFSINVMIISISAFFFGLDLAIYTLAAMFIASQATNYMVDGLNYKRTVFIISDRHEEMAQAVMKRLGRGVTILTGEGAYTKAPKHVLYTTIGIRQVAKLKEIVKSVDSEAFVTITETAQVFGRGFIDIARQ